MASGLSADAVKQIAVDYSLGRPVTGYTPEMLACRDRIHAEYLEFKKLHPDATLEVFGDIDGLPG